MMIFVFQFKMCNQKQQNFCFKKLEMCTFSQSNNLHQFWFDNFEADLFEWSDLTISENTSCLEVFDSPRQTICQKEAKKDLILIETQTIFEDAKLNCNAIGGELFLPKNDSELDKLGNLIDSSKTCPNAILGGKKSNLGSKEIQIRRGSFKKVATV